MLTCCVTVVRLSGNQRSVPPACFGRRYGSCFVSAAVLLRAAVAMASPCGSLSLSFSDNMPSKAIFLAPAESSPRIFAELQVSPDGSRSMQSSYWGAGYRVLPFSADVHTITGETYWVVGASSPAVDIEFQRDSEGRIMREILRGTSAPSAASPQGATRILGWYEYERNDLGQIRHLVYYFSAGPDGRWLTGDDGVWSRVEIDYGLGSDKPRDATISSALGEHVAVRFDYDSADRLTGGVRQGIWPSHFSVVGGLCEEVPERLFVLLLSPNGGPWHPFTGGRRGAQPASPR